MDTSSSKTALFLGYAGLLPFIVPSALSLVDPHHGELLAELVFYYAAIILSFVGALHWAYALQGTHLTDRKRHALYVWSVIPALFAFLALSLGCPPISGALLIIGFVLQLYRDWREHLLGLIPTWFFRLRIQLTIVAIIAIAITI